MKTTELVELLKNTGVFLLAIAGAIGTVLGIRGAWIIAWKELSVGKQRIKELKQADQEMIKRIEMLELDKEKKEFRIGRLERDSDDQHEDIKNLDDKMDMLNKELKNKTI